VDFDEFCEMMSAQSSTLASAGDVQPGGDFRPLFAAFDKDNSGYIDADELRQTMSAVGLQLSDGDVVVMMNAAGVPAGGRIYYEGEYTDASPLNYCTVTYITRHLLHCALAAAQCIIIGPVCLWVGV